MTDTVDELHHLDKATFLGHGHQADFADCTHRHGIPKEMATKHPFRIYGEKVYGTWRCIAIGPVGFPTFASTY